MNKDPDFRLVKSNILYPHKKKKHIQELLREIKEQMNYEVEAMLDNRLLTTNDKLDYDKQTSDSLNETPNPDYLTPITSPVPSEQIDLTLDHQPQVAMPEINHVSRENEQTMIDPTDKVDKGLLYPTKHHEELPKT